MKTMRKSRWLAILVTLVMVFAMSATAFAAPAPINRVPDLATPTNTAAITKVSNLMAGQNTDVGDLYINAIGTNKYLITYKLVAENYYFDQIHFEAISDENVDPYVDDSLIIYSKGGIIPGKLTVNETFLRPTVDEITGVISGGIRQYNFIYQSGAPVDNFAAHAVVCLATKNTTQVQVQTGTTTEVRYIVSDETTALAGGGTAVEVREPYDYIPESNGTPVVEDPSVWDAAFLSNSPTFYNMMLDTGAEIIWKSLYSSEDTTQTINTASNYISNYNTKYGGVTSLTVPFDAPEGLTKAELFLVADNAYIVRVGENIFSHSFVAEQYINRTVDLTDTVDMNTIFNTLRPTDGIGPDYVPLFTQNVVIDRGTTNTWQQMITTPIDLTSDLQTGGTIEIKAINEYRGPVDSQAWGTSYDNPAGVIFMLKYQYTVPVYEDQNRFNLTFACETAWGKGTDANGNNWSQIIEPKLFQTLVVQSNNSTGIDSAPLTFGKDYLIEVNGTWKFVNWATVALPDLGFADAEYSHRIPFVLAPNSVNDWVSGDALTSGYVGYLELQINNQNINWGAFNAEHVYQFGISGAGNPLHFRILDNYYGDNVGSLTVNIYELP